MDEHIVRRNQNRLLKRRRREDLDAFRAVVKTYEGRRVLALLLEQVGYGKSIWHASAAIHYNSGRQDLGNELMATLLEVSEVETELMLREQRQRQRLAATEDRDAIGGSDGGSS